MGNETRTDPVVVATAGTLQQADVMRAALEMAGIPVFVPHELSSNWMAHWGVAVNPRGIEIAVHAKDVQAAREVLRPHLAGRAPEEQAPSPDRYAESAYRAAFYAILLPPIVAACLYYFVRAARAQRTRPPENPKQFTRRLLVAFVVRILLPLAWASAVCLGMLGLLR
jgi:hypothetical protein